MFNSLVEIIRDLNDGKIVCLADSPNLENEIDMMCLAKYATPENINYMIRNARGLVCCPMAAEWCDRIGFEPMVNNNIRVDHLGTPFFQSVDLNNGSTGVSAIERSKTANRISSQRATLDDFVSPGHLFTLRARPGLLKERQGHTEGSVALAGLCDPDSPVAIICEIINNDGTMLTLNDFQEWNADKNLKLFTIDKLTELF